MQSRDFVFWLQGFFELTDQTNPLTPYQIELIKTHLDLVFKHDPSIPRKQMEHKIPVQPMDWTKAPVPPNWNQQHIWNPLDGVTVTC